MQTEITQPGELLLPSGILVMIGKVCQPDIILQVTANPDNHRGTNTHNTLNQLS
jgi:hypothetical protein